MTLGIESHDRVAIRSGLKAGEEIVVSGQFLIDSESNIEAALGRMDSSGDDTQDGHEPMDHADMQHDTTDDGAVDHSGMDHSEDTEEPAMQHDHGEMDHSEMEPQQ